MKYDAILVLGISTYKTQYRYRVEKAAKIYHQGLTSHIIFSGRWYGGLRRAPKYTEAECMAQYAQKLGVPKSAIHKEDTSIHTLSNFYITKKEFLKPHKWHRLLVISHKAHLPKVRFIAKKALGPDYTVTFTTDGAPHELRKEPTPLSTFKKKHPQLLSIEDGDDRAIAQFIKNSPKPLPSKKRI